MLRRLLRVLVVLSVIVVVAVTAIWFLTNTDFGRERARRLVLGVLQGQTHGIVKVDAMHGNLLTGATMVNVSITDSAGNRFLKADSITMRYAVRNFLSNRLDFADLVAYRPDVVIARLPDGPWNYRILWPATKATPGDTTPSWGSWVTLTNATVLDGNITVRSPWAPREGLTAHARDSVIKDALDAGSRLYIARVTGGFQKVVTLQKLNAKFPLIRWADPKYKTRLMQVAALSMDAYPFRPPAAQVRGLTGNFDFNDDSLWWKGAAVRMPQSALRGDGSYNMNNGDMRLTVGAAPASFADFKWLYQRMPDGGGNAGLTIQWKGATQDYVIRDADVKMGDAHVQGDIGVTMTDTVFYHDANLRFTGLTTKQITEIDPTMVSPRPGVLSGRAKFSGTPKRLKLDGDVTFLAYGRGASRVVAVGTVGIAGKPVVVSANDLHVHVTPLQMDIVKLLFPTLPIGGTLTGTTVLNGSGAQQLVASALDIVHQDGPNVSHATGRAAFHTLARQTMDVDVVARPVALAELSKFAPALGLKGSATGPLHAHGPIDALVMDTRLSLPGGGVFALRGPVDFLSKELGYDVAINTTSLDLSRVMVGGPPTQLTGGGRASGRGFKPPTMVSDLDFAFGRSAYDTISVDTVAVRARLANGLANVTNATVRLAGAQADVTGQLGLDARHAGALTYSVVVDSLSTFARFIPGGAAATDTGVVRPRPMLIAEAVQRARADSSRVARSSEVARVVGGLPPVRLSVDTPASIPRGGVAGSLRAAGTVTGSIERFNLQGTASASGLRVMGNTAHQVEATYSWLDARTKRSKLNAALRADAVSAAGFAFDSLTTDVSYLAPNGTVAVRVRQGAQRDYALRGDFTIDKARNELRLADVALRFDTTTWRTTHASAVRFGTSGVEVMNLELVSGPGRRIYANGLLPTKGTANFDLQVTDFAVENVAQLLQSDLPVTGRLNLDTHVGGVAEDPNIRGKLDFVHATYNATAVPDVHGTFAYANRRLTTDATAVDTNGTRLAVVTGTIPIDLALSGVTGSRLLDQPMDVTLKSDSLPLGLLPQLTEAVTDVAGRATANVHVTGTIKRPVLQGNLILSDAQVKVAASGTFLQHMNGSVRMTGDTVFVDSIAAIANGPVRVAGTVAVGDFRDPTFNLSLQASDAQLLNNEQGEIHADAGLRVSGPLTKPYVSGQVTVLHGVFYIPTATGKKVIGTNDPELFSVVDTSITAQRDLFPVQSALFKNLGVDVDIAVQRNTWVRSKDANVELYTDGPIRVSMVGDALSLTGVIDADRGEYTFLGKRFQIKRGSAMFIGTPDLNPTVQITAEYQVKQATGATNIRVLIGGTVLAPRISLESDAQPPLSQSDLLSYLAFGERSTSLLQFNTTSLTSQQGGNLINAASSRLAGVAIGVALDEVEGNAARSLGVDVFNITPGDVPVTVGQSGFEQFIRGTEIEAGRYVTPETFVTFIGSPGSFACRRGSGENSSCVPPGVSLTRRTAKGYRLETSFSPRYILAAPTLAGQSATGIGQFGLFLIREWRF